MTVEARLLAKLEERFTQRWLCDSLELQLRITPYFNTGYHRIDIRCSTLKALHRTRGEGFSGRSLRRAVRSAV